MYLKALEIQGFKSFPDKTRLTFEKDITAIVGPNGSGKSNISDAVLWVMGEQRTKALRGAKMEDVIFGGTEKRNPVGYAQVTLIIDNSKRIFNSDNSEIMITRRYYRSGESEYYLNRESVRLKDINELLMDTGLGRAGYSIIGQGKIAEIVSAKSADRRATFEEAAGISKYRYRKEESERKLARTDENLVRISDKIDELEMQVGPLKAQAETAKKYLKLRDELRLLEISVWMDSLDRIREQAQSVSDDYENAKSCVEESNRQLEELYAEAENLSGMMREKDSELEKTREELSFAESACAECESSAAVLEANLKNNAETIQRIQSDAREQEDRASGIDEQVRARRDRIDNISREKSLIDASMLDIARRGEETAAQSDDAGRRLTQLLAGESARAEALAGHNMQITMLEESAHQVTQRETQRAGEYAAAHKKLETTESSLSADRKNLGEAKERVTGLSNTLAGHKLLLGGREEKVNQLSERLTKLTIDARSMDSRISMLAEMEKDYEGFSKAVKTVMRQAQTGALRGVHGPVANLVKVSQRFALAIETALGGAMQNIIVDTPESGRAAIELLKRHDAGRGTFLPLASVRGGVLTQTPDGEPGYLGLAYELAEFDDKYSGIFSNLLGRTAVTETLADAVRIAKKFNNNFRIVSLDGQVINAGGSMTGGSAVKGTGVISRANELTRLRGQRKELEAQYEECMDGHARAKRELDGAKYEMETASEALSEARTQLHRFEAAVSQSELLLASVEDTLKSLEAEKALLEERAKETSVRVEQARDECAGIQSDIAAIRRDIAELTQGRQELERRRQEVSDELSAMRASLASLQAERETTLGAIDELERLRRDISGENSERTALISALEARNADIYAELDQTRERLSALTQQVARHKTSVTEIAGSRLELEGKRTRAEKSGQEKNRELLDMERICARFEQKKLAADMEEKQLIDKLWDTYELSFSAAQQARQPLESVQKAKHRISGLKNDITALGNPNLGAIDEYARVSERYEFLAGQRDDVLKAKTELEGIIEDITEEMKAIFLRQFKLIDEYFRQTFLDLFGGGRAALTLEDEEDVLECGIDIKVQPPGKSLTNISLLSGGEMAFVAIALYFAILKVSPTPFCVMDEIEAALDEANVSKFAAYLRTMSNKTQFLIITHRRGTMEEADMLYGVTMQEKGVSTVIELDLNEAEKTIA